MSVTNLITYRNYVPSICPSAEPPRPVISGAASVRKRICVSPSARQCRCGSRSRSQTRYSNLYLMSEGRINGEKTPPHRKHRFLGESELVYLLLISSEKSKVDPELDSRRLPQFAGQFARSFSVRVKTRPLAPEQWPGPITHAFPDRANYQAFAK